MKTITIRLNDDLIAKLDSVTKEGNRTKSEVIREALEKHLTQLKFQQLRKKTLPFAEAQGILTDEDVFNEIS
ncbi:MAG: putative transcriptional regulator [Cyclobacteriaceae bacterium]|jgi:predicted transcriptional regulator